MLLILNFRKLIHSMSVMLKHFLLEVVMGHYKLMIAYHQCWEGYLFPEAQVTLRSYYLMNK